MTKTILRVKVVQNLDFELFEMLFMDLDKIYHISISFFDQYKIKDLWRKLQKLEITLPPSCEEVRGSYFVYQ